jgi:hypothetical protein
MRTTEDFTALAEGVLVPLEGTVVRCPRCGRNGIYHRPSIGLPYCVHIEQTVVLGDGMRIDPTDCCELAEA